jgi:hypothetical protein
MPVELIAVWLVSQAYKLVAVPIANNLMKRVNDKIADKIAATTSKMLFGDRPPGDNDETVGGSGTAHESDLDLAKTISNEPQIRAALNGDMEKIIGVSLRGGEGQRGTPAWYVSGYAAVLWRVAMLAVWEERPIAIHGALQGQEWVTVCVPGKDKVIDPSTMWRQGDSGMLLRVIDRPPADFFVCQIKDSSERERVLAELNQQFMIDPTAPFEPAEADSVANSWHRVDGVSRAWVLLKPDPDLERAIEDARPRYEGLNISPRDLRTWPLAFNEYPKEWEPLLRIGSAEDGIAALGAGADEFAGASDASAAAVEKALGKLGTARDNNVDCPVHE